MKRKAVHCTFLGFLQCTTLVAPALESIDMFRTCNRTVHGHLLYSSRTYVICVSWGALEKRLWVSWMPFTITTYTRIGMYSCKLTHIGFSRCKD